MQNPVTFGEAKQLFETAPSMLSLLRVFLCVCDHGDSLLVQLH